MKKKELVILLSGIGFILLFITTMALLSDFGSKNTDPRVTRTHVNSTEIIGGLTFEKRKEIYKAIILAEESTDHIKDSEKNKAAVEKAHIDVMKKYNISKEQFDQITEEAFKYNWPISYK